MHLSSKSLGACFQVEVVPRRSNETDEEQGELTYIDAAGNQVQQNPARIGARRHSRFHARGARHPQTHNLVQGRVGSAGEIIPLFGRLSTDDQQRVFAPSDRRKIVIATNVAETSLTIPGIRFVVDAGLARISRYTHVLGRSDCPSSLSPRAAPISAKAGPAGVQSGERIRLYSEQDFLSRPQHTQPEIQRANLAEVILRMKASHLGNIETFPFLDPPSPAAINSGYELLQELDALDPARHLTPLGRDLARLPVDPTVGRMLLQAQRESCVKEMLVIAAGLSIQDAREQQADAKDAADKGAKNIRAPAIRLSHPSERLERLRRRT